MPKRMTRSPETALRLAAARAVAGHAVPDEVLASVSKRLSALPIADAIRRLDICTYGICVDYFVEPERWRDFLGELFDTDLRIRKLDSFPWGIIRDDLLQVRVQYEMDELASVAQPKLSTPMGPGF